MNFMLALILLGVVVGDGSCCWRHKALRISWGKAFALGLVGKELLVRRRRFLLLFRCQSVILKSVKSLKGMAPLSLRVKRVRNCGHGRLVIQI